MPNTPQDSDDNACKGELVQVAAELRGAVQEISEEVTEIRSLFTGPIPPPDLLRAYENILPGLADRVVSMAEKEGDHRRRQETKGLDAEIEVNFLLATSYTADVKRGQKFALCIGICAITVGGLVAVLGQPVVGGLLGTGGLIGLVKAFIDGRKNDSNTKDVTQNKIEYIDDNDD